MSTKVRGSLMCPKCGARWTLVGDSTLGEEFCPSCGTQGTSREERHTESAESQELPPLPQEQNYIRYITRRYIEAVEAFRRTLDEKDRKFVLSAVNRELEALEAFESFLEKIGLPLEIPIVEEEALVSKVGRNLEASLSRAAAARDAFFELFGSEEALKSIRGRYGKG